MPNSAAREEATMAMQNATRPRLDIARERLVLIGTPPMLGGMLRLANPGAEKVKLKSAVLRLNDGQWGDPHVSLLLDIGARLPAGVTAHAPVSLAIDPRMPPGEWRGEVRFDELGETRDVVLRVLEHRAQAVTPSRFELYGRPGASVRMPVVIGNLGNVAFTVPKVALVALGEDNAFHQLFHVAMARKGGEGHQAALDAFTQLLGATEVDAAKALVGAGAGKPLAAGESLETEITFELPARLARHRAYHGTFSIGKAQCDVEIEVASEADDEPPAAEPARN
jgi:hypothetical protein